MQSYAYSVSVKLTNWISFRSGYPGGKNTVARLGAKLSTQNVPVIIDKELAPGFLGHLVSAISGGSLYRKSSFLLDSLGEQLFPDWFEIFERLHLKKALASSAFDNEGVATHDMDIVTNGMLNHYLYTSYSARKLELRQMDMLVVFTIGWLKTVVKLRNNCLKKWAGLLVPS